MAVRAFFRQLTLVPQGVTVVVAAFLPIFAIVTMFPAVPSIIDHFAADPAARWKVPMMVSAPGLTIAIFAPLSGWLVDRVGRRPILIGATLLYGIVGTAPFFLNSLDALVASRLVLGVAEAAILTIVNTLIGDYWEDTGRRNWLFIQGVIGPLLASGVILVAGPLTTLRWNGVFLIYAVAFPIMLAMIACLYEPERAHRAGATAGGLPGEADEPFPARSVALIGGTTLLAATLYYTFVINGGLAFREVGVQSASRLSEITAIPSLFVMFGALVFRLLGGRPAPVLLGTFFSILGVGLVGIGLAPDYRWMIAAMVLQQTGTGMTVPSLIAWAQSRLPMRHRGKGMGIWSACFFFGQFSSPWFVHHFDVATGSMQGAFLVMGVVAILSGLVAYANLARRRTAT